MKTLNEHLEQINEGQSKFGFAFNTFEDYYVDMMKRFGKQFIKLVKQHGFNPTKQVVAKLVNDGFRDYYETSFVCNGHEFEIQFDKQRLKDLDFNMTLNVKNLSTHKELHIHNPKMSDWNIEQFCENLIIYLKATKG